LIEGIRVEWLDQYWPIVHPWIDAACRETGALQSADDLRRGIESRTHQLWVVWATSERPTMAIVTEVYDTAAGLTCSMTVVGGALLGRSWHALETIEAWAKDQGCVRITCEGRLGWQRLMTPRGWRVASVQMEKRLGQEQDDEQHVSGHQSAA
jgi:hypothetical protein